MEKTTLELFKEYYNEIINLATNYNNTQEIIPQIEAEPRNDYIINVTSFQILSAFKVDVESRLATFRFNS